MGLVKAALGAASGVMGDQWKEYFYCSALPAEVLAVKGQKKVSGRSSNRHGAENIITDGPSWRWPRASAPHRGAGQGGGPLRRGRRVHL